MFRSEPTSLCVREDYLCVYDFPDSI
ncbi:unnamed protein product [Ectocarpus sp. CCAP 1310/34]|nr:unnamed protein product [Ectocarpus sp. CCAP 1310/34]